MRAHIKIKTPEAGEIAKVLEVEERDAISKAKIYQSKDRLVLSIEADDVSDLRAAINSWLRLIKMCVEISEVLRNG